MTRALPFTVAAITRTMKAVELAGRHVLGVRPDGTVIVGDKPIDADSLIPPAVQNVPASKWEDEGA